MTSITPVSLDDFIMPNNTCLALSESYRDYAKSLSDISLQQLKELKPGILWNDIKNNCMYWRCKNGTKRACYESNQVRVDKIDTSKVKYLSLDVLMKTLDRDLVRALPAPSKAELSLFEEKLKATKIVASMSRKFLLNFFDVALKNNGKYPAEIIFGFNLGDHFDRERTNNVILARNKGLEVTNAFDLIGTKELCEFEMSSVIYTDFAKIDGDRLRLLSQMSFKDLEIWYLFEKISQRVEKEVRQVSEGESCIKCFFDVQDDKFIFKSIYFEKI